MSDGIAPYPEVEDVHDVVGVGPPSSSFSMVLPMAKGAVVAMMMTTMMTTMTMRATITMRK